jgi:hypothetical protein
MTHYRPERGTNMDLKGHAAQALREAGYKPCPRWWLTEEQLDLVAYMAKQNADEVNRIRVFANLRKKMEEDDA